MFGNKRGHVRGDPDPSLLDDELLKELAGNTTAEVQAQRMHPRFTVSLPVTVRPGNFSDRSRGNAVGRTVDLSQGGCLVIFETAVNVGDVYAIDIDRRNTKLPMIYARCVRARMLHDDAIEAGFSFFLSLDANELNESIKRLGASAREAAA